MSLKKFHFEGISRDGKRLAGFLFSESKEAARAKLQGDGLAVLNLEPYMENKATGEGFERFEFKGIAAHGREVRGEIEAQNQYAAYKKLRLEYDFDIQYLIPKNLSYEEKEELKKRPLDPELERIFLEDKNIRSARKQKASEKKKDQIEEMLGNRREEMKFLQGEIEKCITKIQVLLDENSDYLDPSMRRDIQSRIDRLSRLRQSSSVVHLESMMKQLFSDLGNDNIFLVTVREQFPDFEVRRARFLEASSSLKGSLGKGLAAVKITEGDIKKLKALVRLEPLVKVLYVFYWGFLFLFFMMLNFWGLNLVKIMVGYEVEKAYFYFNSPIFWFVTGFSGVVAIFIAPEIFSESEHSWKIKVGVYGATILALIVLTIQFPVFFWWTE